MQEWQARKGTSSYVTFVWYLAASPKPYILRIYTIYTYIYIYTHMHIVNCTPSRLSHIAMEKSSTCQYFFVFFARVGWGTCLFCFKCDEKMAFLVSSKTDGVGPTVRSGEVCPDAEPWFCGS